jgi:hypothetical protein
MVSWIPDSSPCLRQICENLRNLWKLKLNMREHLPALTAKISAALAARPEVFITHPAELRVLSAMSEDELGKFAAEHGWETVRRIGGRQIEFYNDARVRMRDL